MATLRYIEDALPGLTQFLECTLWSQENHLSTEARLQLHNIVTHLRTLRNASNDLDWLADNSPHHVPQPAPIPPTSNQHQAWFPNEISSSPYGAAANSEESQSAATVGYASNGGYFFSSTPPPEHFPPAPVLMTPNILPETNLTFQQRLHQISAPPAFAVRNALHSKSRSLPPSAAPMAFPQRNTGSSASSRFFSHIKARWSMGREVDITEQEALYEEAVCDPGLTECSPPREVPLSATASTAAKARISSPILSYNGTKCNPDDITLPRPQRMNPAAPPPSAMAMYPGLFPSSNGAPPGSNSGNQNNVSNVARRRYSCVQLVEQTWTLVGSLWHRYKNSTTSGTKWQPLGFCVLAGGGRLLGYRSPRSNNPVLNLFLVGGHRPVYAGKEGEMDHVFKLTHPTFGTCVLAAPTQDQAMGWIEQIAMYCVGQLPSQTKSYLNATLQDNHEDSGFSAPVSSGSSGEAGGQGAGISGGGQEPASPATPVVAPVPSASSVKIQRSAASPPIQENAAMQSRSSGGSASGGGASGILSSMRRKVESIGAKKRMRKVMSMQFHPADDCIISGLAKIRITKRGNWCERLCQLRPRVLEAYRMNLQSGNNNNNNTSSSQLSDANHNQARHVQAFSQSQADLELDFALSLDNIQLGLCQDKKHASALKFSCPDATDVMLFEISDKLQMGAWIRGFIQAMGLIPEVSYESINEWLPVGSPLSTARTNTPYPPFLMTNSRRVSQRRHVPVKEDEPVTTNQTSSLAPAVPVEPIYDEVCIGNHHPVTHPHSGQHQLRSGNHPELPSVAVSKRGGLPPVPSTTEERPRTTSQTITFPPPPPPPPPPPRSIVPETPSDLARCSNDPNMQPNIEHIEEDEESCVEEEVVEEESETLTKTSPTSPTSTSKCTSPHQKCVLSRHHSMLNPSRRVSRVKSTHDGVASSSRPLDAILTRACSLADLIARMDEEEQEVAHSASSTPQPPPPPVHRNDSQIQSSTGCTADVRQELRKPTEESSIYYEYDILALPREQVERNVDVVYELPPEEEDDVETQEKLSPNVHSPDPNLQCQSTTSSYHSAFSDSAPGLTNYPTGPGSMVTTPGCRSHSVDGVLPRPLSTATCASASTSVPCSPFKRGVLTSNNNNPQDVTVTVSHRTSLRRTSFEVGNPQIDALKAQVLELRTLKCKLEKCHSDNSSNGISREDILVLDVEIRKKETQLQVLEMEARRRFTIHETSPVKQQQQHPTPLSIAQ